MGIFWPLLGRHRESCAANAWGVGEGGGWRPFGSNLLEREMSKQKLEKIFSAAGARVHLDQPSP